MIRRVVLVSGLIVLGAMSVASKASAQSVTTDVNFKGSIPKVCTFGQPQDGQLVTVSSPDKTPIALEASLFPGGWGEGSTVGQVSLKCNTSATVTVADPVQTAGPRDQTFQSLSSNVTADNGKTYAYSKSPWVGQPGSISISVPAAKGTSTPNLQVGMIALNNDGIAAGDYSFKVTVTASPN
jgi:hypothetical protein